MQVACLVVAGVVVKVGRNAEVDVERRGAVALQLVGGGVIPERNGLVGARPARRGVGRLLGGQREDCRWWSARR